jgi:hypothetical protein
VTQYVSPNAVYQYDASPIYPPLSVTLTLAPGLFSGTVYVKTTYVSAVGETTPSPEASIVASGNSIIVSPPPAVPGAIGYNVYASSTPGAERGFLQTSNFSTPFTIHFLVAPGPAPPSANTAGSPSGPPPLTCLQTFPPAYVYQEYADDDNIQAFFQAYNDYAEQYLLWFNTLNLPIYTGGIVAGALLDWVGQGIYGIMRPTVTTGSALTIAAINSMPINFTALNQSSTTSTEALQSTSDDIYRRVITWNFYKGDGFVFNVQWLKRRVLRFLNGVNGISPVIDNTFAVSVAISGAAFTVTVPTGNATNISLLNALINSGACATPFQYTFSVVT